MQSNDLIMELGQVLSANEALQALTALRQDGLVWQSLAQADFCQLARDQAGSQVTCWAPGRLALLSLGDMRPLEVYKNQPMIGLNPPIQERMLHVFQTAQRTGRPPASLTEAGLLALALRERRRLTGNWNGLLMELMAKQAAASPVASSLYEVWSTPLACLYALIPDPDEMLRALLPRTPMQTAFEWITHIQISQPVSEEIHVQVFSRLLQGQPVHAQLDLLRCLSLRGCETIAAELANRLLVGHPGFASLRGQTNANDLDLAGLAGRALSLQQMGAFYQLAGDRAQALSLYNSAEITLNQWMAGLFLQRLNLQAGSGLRDTGVLMESSQVSHLAASANWLKNELGAVLVSHPCASSVLDQVAVEQEGPFFQLKRARQLYEREPAIAHDLARQGAAGLLDDIRRCGIPFNGDFVYTWRPEDVLDILLDLDLLEEAQQLAEALLAVRPTDIDLLQRASLIEERLDQPEAAIESTRAAAALDPHNPAWQRRLGSLYGQISEWQSALLAYLAALDRSETPLLEDQLACGRAALRAGSLDQAVALGELVLTADANNGAAQGLVGQALVARGEPSRALAYLVRATLLAPELLAPWLTLAMVQQQVGESQRALETLRAAVTAVPEAPEAHMALGQACLTASLPAEALPHLKKAFLLSSEPDPAALLYARTLRALGHTHEARNVLERVRAAWASSPQLPYEYALVLLDLEDAEGALPVLEMALRSGLPVLEGYLLYARILLGDVRGDAVSQEVEMTPARMQQAGQALEHILSVDPDCLEARFLMADILRERGDLEEALEAYRVLADSAAGSANGLCWRIQWGLGRTALRLGQSAIALAALKEACHAKPDSLMLQRELAEASLQAYLPQEGLEAATYALQLAPDDLEMLAWYADFVTRAGESKRAVEALERAVQLDPGRPDLLVSLARGQLSSGDLTDAVATLEAFAALPNVRRADLRRAAHVYLRLEQPQAALACYQRALEQDPPAPAEFLFEVAQLHERLGRHESALELAQQALEENPQSLPIHLLQADLLTHLNRPQAALAVLERALRVAQSDQTLQSAADLQDEQNSPATRTLLGEIHERFTRLMLKANDLPAALHHAERALTMHPTDAVLCYRAADLALALLQTERAGRIVKAFKPGSTPRAAVLLESGKDGLDLLCLEIEMALDDASAADASEDAANLTHWIADGLKAAPSEPRLMAAQIRWLVRQGDLPAAQRIFSALWKQAGNEASAWLAETALETERWAEALIAAQRCAEAAPTEARAQLTYARVLVQCAERQRLCAAVGCQTNVPGMVAISETNRDAFEDTIQAAARLANAGEIGRWQARGQAIFNPSAQSARSLAAMPGQPEDTAALVAVLRQLNNRAAAIQVARRYVDHPLVQLQLALCYLADPSPEGLAAAQRAVSANPNQPLAHVILARLLAQSGELVASLDEYESALTLWPNEPEWHDAAGDLCLQVGNAAAGIIHRKQALELNPRQARYAFKLGQACLADEDITSAIGCLENSVALDAEQADVWLTLATAYHMADRLPQSLEAARKASELNPASAEALLVAGETALSMNQTDQALEFAQSALRREPENAGVVLFLGSVLVMRGRAEDALHVIEQASQAVKAVFPVAFERAKLIHRLHGPQPALEVLEKLVKDFPEEPDLLGFLARIQAECGEFKSAERYAFKALRLDPNQPDLTLMLGRLQRKTGQLDQAVHLLTEAIRMDPTNLDAYVELGSVFQERREFPQALQIYQQAMRVAPTDYQAFYASGLILRDGKDYSGAEEMLRRAAELAPDNLSIRRQLVAVIALNLVHHKQEVAVS